MVRPMLPKPAKKPVGRPPNITKRSVGRPTLITPRVIEQIAKVIRFGNRISCAAGSVGINRETLRLWQKKGKELQAKGPPWTDDEALYVVLVQKIERALDTAERNCIRQIKEAAKIDWKAAAWIAEHHPEMREAWKKHDERTLVHKGSVEHQHAHVSITAEDFARMSLDDKKRMLEILRAKKAGLPIPAPEPRIIESLPLPPPEESSPPE